MLGEVIVGVGLPRWFELEDRKEVWIDLGCAPARRKGEEQPKVTLSAEQYAVRYWVFLIGNGKREVSN